MADPQKLHEIIGRLYALAESQQELIKKQQEAIRQLAEKVRSNEQEKTEDDS